jgi:hypothetical protein
MVAKESKNAIVQKFSREFIQKLAKVQEVFRFHNVHELFQFY